MEKDKVVSRVYFQNLDVLRFVAAYLVVIVHGYAAMKGWFGLPHMLRGDFPKEPNTVWSYFQNAIDNFGYGVDIFFLISGFLITYLLLKEKEITGKISLKDFYIRRTLRIWPLYYFIIILSPFLVQWTHSTPPPNYLAQIFFVGNFDTIRTGSWIFPFAHYWSICIEEHFYLVWPFLVAFIPTKKLPVVFSSIIMGSILFRLYMYMSNDYNYYHYYLHTLSRIDVLAVGAMFAYLHSLKPLKVNIPGPIRIMIYLMLAILVCTDHIHTYNNVMEVTFKKYIYLALISAVIGSFLFGTNNKLAPKKRNILHYFGKVSYGIYMYHNVLINVIVVKVIYPLQLTSGQQALFCAVYFPACLILPIISYELIEKPFLKLKTRFEIIKTNR